MNKLYFNYSNAGITFLRTAIMAYGNLNIKFLAGISHQNDIRSKRPIWFIKKNVFEAAGQIKLFENLLPTGVGYKILYEKTGTGFQGDLITVLE